MPPEIWVDSEIDNMNRYSRYVEASKRIDNLNRCLLAFARSNSDWPMLVSDEEEALINEMINKVEK
jgi:hypothetical protein